MLSKGEADGKKLLIRQLEKLNPEAKLRLDTQGFIRMHRKDASPFKLAKNWFCQEGQEASPNSITLRHIYCGKETFIGTIILYQNA